MPAKKFKLRIFRNEWIKVAFIMRDLGKRRVRVGRCGSRNIVGAAQLNLSKRGCPWGGFGQPVFFGLCDIALRRVTRFLVGRLNSSQLTLGLESVSWRPRCHFIDVNSWFPVFVIWWWLRRCVCLNQRRDESCLAWRFMSLNAGSAAAHARDNNWGARMQGYNMSFPCSLSSIRFLAEVAHSYS